MTVMKLTLNTLLITVGITYASLAWSQESARETLEGSWEGPLVIGRDNMNLAFTFQHER
jgi:hypothetical protein